MSSLDSVEILMRDCNCTRERAITLLKICDNDIDEAKKHHHVFQSYAQTPDDRSPSPSTPEFLEFGQGNLAFRTPSQSRSDSPMSHRSSSGDSQVSSHDVNENNGHREWDFILPRLPRLEISTEDDFSPDTIAAAIQHGVPTYRIRNYLNIYDPRLLELDINSNVMGFPLIFYAVESNNEDMVRLLVDFGASVASIYEPSQVPLLAFAIICGETLQMDTANMVSVLLSKGASARVIPMELFIPYLQDTSTGLEQKGKRQIDETGEAAWCSPATKARLAENINLTQRYFLEKSTKLKPPSTKRRQIARLKNCQGLLGIPYFLVGQSVATELLIQRLLTHLMMPTKQPLVLCFAGPSGHGKTELARQLGHLLSLDLEVVDCTTFNHEMELFGPRRPYSGYEKGSAVNNFLVEHSGKRCIVFLDEFEKTTKEIHQSLLLPFDNDFYDQNDGIAGDDADEKSRLAPVTGRISDFIPLLPFSAGEQAVITHKCLLELAQDLRLPISLSNGPSERLIGNIRLLIRKDGKVCSTLAKSHYHNKLGARSLKTGAQKVKRIILDAYLDDDKEINEQEALRDFVIDVDGEDIVGKIIG
ncbi:p-loop containing nucleoside triphosphate hydrolase [Trichoderma arundinaceum]|uniref:p-loop containing nucleoside triphosphate hydrolase n=1 Tax=Trichoderma arundinaceum TaxID=490622 RepID=A0A395NDS5_TRIAR|nr:p-loop containing nucleoside triphosphate hydrolase [Trichoderma arundinaceum]